MPFRRCVRNGESLSGVKWDGGVGVGKGLGDGLKEINYLKKYVEFF